MLYLISAILFSISANIDNIPIGISYGIKKITLSLKTIFLISFCTTIMTYLAMEIGDILLTFLNPNIANIIGATALILIGSYGILKELMIKIQKNKLHTRQEDLTDINHVKLVSLILLIVTLSWNNLATGFAASFAGINIYLAVFFNFLFSFLFLLIGNNIGKNVLNQFVQKYATLFSSFILILLGIFELLL